MKRCSLSLSLPPFSSLPIRSSLLGRTLSLTNRCRVTPYELSPCCQNTLNELRVWFPTANFTWHFHARHDARDQRIIWRKRCFQSFRILLSFVLSFFFFPFSFLKEEFFGKKGKYIHFISRGVCVINVCFELLLKVVSYTLTAIYLFANCLWSI